MRSPLSSHLARRPPRLPPRWRAPLFGASLLAAACSGDDTGSASTSATGASSTSSSSSSAGGTGGSLASLGTACDDGAACASGHCVDGVCCDGACDQACAACSASLGATADGTCTASSVVEATDPGACDADVGDCGGACRCDAKGACGRVPPKVVQVATSLNHSCAVFEDGTMKCWGGNGAGQLGLGDTSSRGLVPEQLGDALPLLDLGAGAKVLAVSLADTGSCALLEGGAVKCWGANTYGQLGQGDTENRGDAPGELGLGLPPVNLGNAKKAKAIAAGLFHTCALLVDGAVKCWGRNDFGQLGVGDTKDRGANADDLGDLLPAVDLGTGKKATALAASGSHTCALLDDGTVKCWGHNAFGQLGAGDTKTRGTSPLDMGDALPAVNLGTGTKVVALAVSGPGVGTPIYTAHSCALLEGGTVKCWGGNHLGQLGIGDTANRGDGPGELGDALPAVNLGTGKAALSLHLGEHRSCARITGDAVKCWGWNGYGQLGTGDTKNRGDGPDELGDALPAVNLGTGRTAVFLGAGGEHTCAGLDDGALKCWGWNDDGQLGTGDTETRGLSPKELGDALPAVKLFGP